MKKELIIKLVSKVALYTVGLLLILYLRLSIFCTIMLIGIWVSIAICLFLKDHLNIIKEERKNELQRVSEIIANHTVFNFINVISYLCRKDTEKARESLIHLSNYIRKGFRGEESLWEIGDEISFIESYLFIQTIRFKDKMNIDYVLNNSKGEIKVYSIFGIVKIYLESSYKEGYKNFNLLVNYDNIIINRISDGGIEEKIKINI